MTSTSFLNSFDKDVTSSTVSVEPQLKMERKINKSISMNFEAWSKATALEKSKEDRFQLEIDELNIAHEKSGRKIKLGYSARNWEGTDFLNPMEILASKNWIDPLNARPRSGLGLFYDDNFSDFEWDFSYIALQKDPLFPGDHSPWWPRGLVLPTESEGLVLLLPQEMNYEILDAEEIDDALKNNVALRIKYHGPGFDLAIGAAEGISSPPLLVPILNVSPIEVSPREIYQLQNPIQIRPVLYRQRAVAGTLVWTLGETIFRASAQHIQPLGDDPRLPSWSQLGVLGVEHTFYIRSQMLTLLAQYVDSKRPDSAGLSLLTTLYERSYMGGVRWAPSEKWTLLLAHFQETTNWSRFFRADLGWSFKDNWSTNLVWTQFEGRPESVIGTFDQNDFITASLKRSF